MSEQTYAFSDVMLRARHRDCCAWRRLVWPQCDAILWLGDKRAVPSTNEDAFKFNFNSSVLRAPVGPGNAIADHRLSMTYLGFKIAVGGWVLADLRARIAES